MCEEGTSLPLSPSNPRFQLHPTTPEKKTPYSNLQKRIQGDNACFNCGQQGHWVSSCPLKFPNKNAPPNHKSPLSPQNIHCRCGHGFCEIKTSGSARNPGREYYACPIKRGAKCKDYGGFVKWCNEPVDESALQPPLFKYPECECGAGVCRRVKGAEENTNVVKYYFECPVKKDHGSCGYQVSEDAVLNNTSITPIRQSKQRSLDEFFQIGKTENSIGDVLGDRGNLFGPKKRLRIMDNSENPLSMVKSEIPEVEDAGAAVEAADQSKSVGFPEIEIADDDLADLAIQAEPEPDQFPSLSTPSRISARQSAFDRDIVDASLDACLMGWLGRLPSVHPTQGLKVPTPQPIICCVFPSFNPIHVPKQASIIPNGSSECNDLAVNRLNQHTQLPTTCHTEVSRDVVSNSPPSSGNKAMSMSKKQREVGLYMQQKLLSDLENLDPREHESMREAAETTFTLLNRLEVDCEQFSQHVWDFINLTSSIVEMDKSMENTLTLEDHKKRFEEEKMKLDCINDELAETEALLVVSNQHKQSLGEEISHLEAILHEKKNKLESCELETLEMEFHLGDLKRSMLETVITVRDRAEQVEISGKQAEEREAKQVAAKTALENAKHELEN